MKRNPLLIGIFAVAVVFALSSCTFVSHPPKMYAHPPRAVIHNPSPVIVPVHRVVKGYVYYPDYEFYYDYDRNGYYSYDGWNWVFSIEIPLRFRHLHLNNLRFFHYYDQCDYPYKRHHIHKKHHPVIIHSDNYRDKHFYKDDHRWDGHNHKHEMRKDDRHNPYKNFEKNKDHNKKHRKGKHGKGR